MKPSLPSPRRHHRSAVPAHSRTQDRARAGTRSGSSRRILDRALGVTGELLVTVGAVLALFVAWELWWTDIGAGRAQAEIVAGLGWEYGAAPQPIASSSPSASEDPSESAERTDPPTVLPEPGQATTFATMYVPRWGDDYVRPVSQGTDKKRVLDRLGIGHYNGTAMPGGLGNFAVAGHRTTYGKPFGRIEELVAGDAIVLRTEFVWYVYRVTSTTIVAPSSVEVIAPVPGQPGAAPDGRYITLTTCHPQYSAAERYIVHGELAYWMPSTSGTPSELVPAAEASRVPPSAGLPEDGVI